MTCARDATHSLSPGQHSGPAEPHLSHLAATIDIAAQVTARDAEDLAAAARALAVCLDTLEFNMMLSTSILALLAELRASEVGRQEVDRHLASAVDAFSGVTRAAAGCHAAVDPGCAPLQPALAGFVDAFDQQRSVLERMEAAARDVHLIVAHADDQVRTVVAILERSRAIALRGVEKTTAAHGLIGQLQDRLDRTATRMRHVSDELHRGAALVAARSGDAARWPTAPAATGGQFARALIEDVAADVMAGLDRLGADGGR